MPWTVWLIGAIVQPFSTSSTGVRTRMFIGWSWFIDKTPDGLTTVGHTGTQGGFYCNYVTVPEKDIFFTILCNSPRDRPAMTERVLSFLREEQWLQPL